MKISLPVFLSSSSKEIETKSLPISSLAPKILKDKKDVEKIKPYLDSLNKTINEKGITNIALTGGYGSGKSTIIKTFQSLNPQHDYLNISLASFNDIKDENGNPTVKKDELERLLEISILQQIFYHVKPSEIPDSRFKRIVNVTDKKILSIALGLILWVLSTLILFKFNYINKINPTTWKSNNSVDWLAIIIMLIFLTGIGLFAKSVIRLFSNSKINKFNIKGELELGDNLDKSVFNEHIEEIIYFFERTKYDVVVIEDLDRFESTDIFTKLREINILLNNSKLIKREINFLYAIKDEMFKNKSERVKFFEYIIPVIPFINPSTAGDQLTKMIEEAGLKGVLSKDFTEDVVTFIDDIDMRLLVNIFHEYQLYKQNLISDLDQDCLFAMITYKNLFPDDFGELQKRKGNLYEFISKKGSYTKGLLQKIEKEIKEKEKEIKSINDENIIDINELRAIYVNAIHKQISNAVALNLDGKVLFSELTEEDNFQKLKEQERISYYAYNFYSNPYYTEINPRSEVSFSQIEKLVSPKFTYNEREQLILNKRNDSIELLRKEIEKLKNSKSEIESWSLKQIFEEIDINQFLNGFSENQLVRNLLLNGYINENYNDYISLFHEVNLTKDDYAFERKVKSGLYSPFDYKLSKIENLVKKIPEKYYSRDTILNFDMLDFLAENYTQYKKEYDSILSILGNDKKRSIDFVESYIDKREKFNEQFFKSLCKSWIGLWDYVYLKSNFKKDKTRSYIENIIKFADIEDIVFFKNSSNIATYIMQQSDFLSFIKDEKYTDKIKEIIKNLNIKFEALEQPKQETKKLFDYVYQNNHYQINAENIELMLIANNDKISIENIKKANYSTILKSECKTLIEYVNQNINEYVKNAFLKIPENVSESEDEIIQLLNNEDLKDNLKFEIIKKQNTIINDLNQIDEVVIQEHLIEQNKVSPNWNNLYTYYDSLETEEFDTTIIKFLNTDSNYKLLSNISLNEGNKKTDEFITAFSLKLIHCNDLSQESYSYLIKKVPYVWSSLSFEDIDFEKIEWMIEQKKILSFSAKNFIKLKEYFSTLHITFIEKNQNTLISKFEDFTLDESDILSLINSKELNEKIKVQLIQKIDDNIIIQNKEIGKIVCALLANSEFISLEFSVLESLFKNSNSIENRIKLLNKHFDKISNSQIQTLIESLGYYYQEIFKKQHKPKFSNNLYHDLLFKNLTKNKLIKRHEIDPKDKTLLKVIANY